MNSPSRTELLRADSTGKRQRHQSPRNAESEFGNQQNQDPCLLLQQSLKRVRLSSTPGELRLHRDLRHLVHHHHWTYVNNEEYPYYQSPHKEIILRETDDPLTFILHIHQEHTVCLQFHHLYPHRPPSVPRMQTTSHIQTIVICEPHTCPTNMPDGTAVYENWSSIDRLDQIIDFCVASLTRGRTQFYQDSMEEEEDHKQESHNRDPTSVDSVFAPNRFDLGYNKQYYFLQHMDET